MRSNVTRCLSATVAACHLGFYAYGASAETNASAKLPANTRHFSPRDAGVRFGQALGAFRTCYSLKLTPAVETLKLTFTGEHETSFKAEANRVIQAWDTVRSCRHAGGPNECRLSIEMSCAEVLKEIGPAGTVLPGLIEQTP
jgi:hypothetical protein